MSRTSTVQRAPQYMVCQLSLRARGSGVTILAQKHSFDKGDTVLSNKTLRFTHLTYTVQTTGAISTIMADDGRFRPQAKRRVAARASLRFTLTQGERSARPEIGGCGPMQPDARVLRDSGTTSAPRPGARPKSAYRTPRMTTCVGVGRPEYPSLRSQACALLETRASFWDGRRTAEPECVPRPGSQWR